MSSQIYLHETQRKLFKNQIDEFAWCYFNKLLPQFLNIEEESEAYANNLDPFTIGPEDAWDLGVQHYQLLNLGLYQISCTYHATIFEFFHQQIRLFLFSQVSNDHRGKGFSKFCSYLNNVVKIYENHKYDFKKLSSWEKLEELRLLCNVIKHGDGGSCEELRQVNPKIFLKQDDFDLMNLFKTTLIEITLDINDKTLNEYISIVKNIWDELPERCYDS